MLKIKLIFRLFGEIMKRLSKFCILSIILIILSISVVSASEVDNGNIQSSIDDIQEISIDEVSLNEDQSSISDSIQMSNENEESNMKRAI